MTGRQAASPGGMVGVGLHHASTYAIPSSAAAEWDALTAGLEELAEREVEPLCTGDPEAWFATGVREVGVVKAAVAGCRRCPVVVACGAYAVAADERDGIWGGSTAAERNAARRVQRETRRSA